MSPPFVLARVTDRAGRTWAGQAPQAGPGEDLTALVHPADRPLLAQALAQLAQGQSSHLERARLILPGGLVRCRVWVLPLDEPAWPAAAGLILAQEVTAELELAADLDLTRRQLAEALKARTTFLASVSHELRTPLNAILGFAEMLKMGLAGPINEAQAEYLGHCLESGRDLLALINDLLDLSKIETGRMELELKDFSLAELIRDTAALFSEQSLRHRIDLSLAIDEEVGHVQADQRKIKQALYHLLANGFKFTLDGGKVGIKAVLEADQAHVVVWDTGLGLAPDDLGDVFQPFHAGGREAPQGRGASLSLCREIIRLHNGRVWAESAGPGKGSAFHFLLPLRSQVTLETFIERELELARSNQRLLSVILVRVQEFKEIKEFYSPTEFKAFLAAVTERIKRSTRERLDRYFVLEQAGMWVILTPQEEEAAVKTGQRTIDSLTREPLAKGIRLRVEAEVAATYSPQTALARPPRTVLVVDDDPAIRDVVAGLIQAGGDQADTAVDGLEALKKLVQKDYDLLLTDLVMPELSGVELISKARGIGFKGPIIAMTGFEGVRQDAENLGGVDLVIKKPFSFTELKEAMARLLVRDKER